MWYLYGDTHYPLDTSMTNSEGTAVFEKNYQLAGGVFIIYLTPRKVVEFLLTDENIFTINIDTADISGKTSFNGSRENIIYYDFLRKVNANTYQEDLLKKKFKSKAYSADSTAILQSLILTYQKQERLLKKQTIEKNKGTFLADLLKAGLWRDSPLIMSPKEWTKWGKNHFFDDINFSDERLAYSNSLFDAYTEYIGTFVKKTGDSLIAACDTILKKTSAGKENFKWSLYFLSSSFEQSSVAGQDRVFVHLVEEYYKKGKCWWLNKEQIDNMIRRSEQLKKLFVGNTCPDFTALDSSGKEISLHQKINKITVLYFWAYDCKHCLEETPRLAAWIKKHPEINLITACANPDEEKWKEKLREFKLPGTHFIDPEMKANYTYLYSVTATPQIFIIDKDKKIIAKYINDTEELVKFLQDYK